VLTGIKFGFNIELSGSSGLPDILALLLHDLTIEDGDTAETKVCGQLESIFSTVFANREADLVVVTNISVDTTAKLLVGDLSHGGDNLFAVAFRGLALHGLL
jgi:hypothetical protein